MTAKCPLMSAQVQRHLQTPSTGFYPSSEAGELVPPRQRAGRGAGAAPQSQAARAKRTRQPPSENSCSRHCTSRWHLAVHHRVIAHFWNKLGGLSVDSWRRLLTDLYKMCWDYQLPNPIPSPSRIPPYPWLQSKVTLLYSDWRTLQQTVVLSHVSQYSRDPASGFRSKTHSLPGSRRRWVPYEVDIQHELTDKNTGTFVRKFKKKNSAYLLKKLLRAAFFLWTSVLSTSSWLGIFRNKK